MSQAADQREPSVERATLRRILARARPHWLSLSVAVVLLLTGSGITLALPQLAGNFGGALLSAEEPERALASLREGLVLFGALLLVQGLLQVVRRLLLVRVGERVVAELRVEVYAHLLDQAQAFHAQQRTGELLSRLGADIVRVQQTVSSDLASFLRNSVILVGGFALLLQTDPWLTLVMLGVIPPLVLVLSFVGRRIRRLSRRTQAGLAEVSATAQEVLAAIDVVQAFTREDHEVERFTRGVEDVYRDVLRRAVLQDALSSATRLLGFTALGLVLVIGGTMISAGGLEPGELLSFMFYTVLVASSVGSFSDLYSRMQVSLGAGARVLALLDLPLAFAGERERAPVELDGGGLRFRAIGFRYAEDGPWVLDGVDIEIPPDSVCALVGPSGSGKTTLGRLLLRFWDPQRGAVEIDGHDLRELRLEDLRRKLAVVAQEPTLFSGTVRENIRYGRLDATDEEVEEAATAAYAHEFIVELEAGYETRVGERGVLLSGGQRQRIAIARALLRDPLILLLDEATSALDSESEARVQAALEVLQRGRTTLVIAHRLSTVRRADQIIVLDHGRVVERGTHAALMARAGAYAAMVERQALLDDLGETS
ncbi:putative multidrug export ATP-binding/permease protein [Enhygromyxa salina]|uniref:Putative multidrug export ATP-binding/permease protein n=1 Tax=Enhygromyxa salina TaxID=215803 RepID=A0A2S9YBD2_9BACT|nr:ABC transporter ATP-binding protein [Enhygromyxa salina]PRQ02413.1 putative multidrug export ATP-binding/permease protein [Enhygromyxa salina]